MFERVSFEVLQLISTGATLTVLGVVAKLANHSGRVDEKLSQIEYQTRKTNGTVISHGDRLAAVETKVEVINEKIERNL